LIASTSRDPAGEARIPTIAGARGAADAARDVPGLALKPYSGQGMNLDTSDHGLRCGRRVRARCRNHPAA
jgi:hypothetical protein